jgi:hypothetical protein
MHEPGLKYVGVSRDAWRGLQGMTRFEAMRRYLEIVSSTCPLYAYGNSDTNNFESQGNNNKERGNYRNDDISTNFKMGPSMSQEVADP